MMWTNDWRTSTTASNNEDVQVHMRSLTDQGGESSNQGTFFHSFGQNFKHPQLHETLKGKDVMIIGAHVSHPGTKGQYSPSIAAVVASNNESAIQYTAISARVQETTMKTERKTNSRIELLADILREVCDKWKGAKAPKELIVSRDSINFDDPIVREECACIKRIADNVFEWKYPFQEGPFDVKLTYIVVNKNTRLDYIFNPVIPDTEHAHSFDDYLAESDNIGKYRYYIMANEGQRSTPELAKLTSCLNESSQLTPQFEQTAKALPLLLAAKLAKRMHTYFHSSMELPEIDPVQCSDRKGGPDLDRRVKEEVDAVKAVKDRLDLSAGKSRKVPWSAKLDDTMFYI